MPAAAAAAMQRVALVGSPNAGKTCMPFGVKPFRMTTASAP